MPEYGVCTMCGKMVPLRNGNSRLKWGTCPNCKNRVEKEISR